MTVTLERRFFAIVDGQSEFEWILHELGFKDDELADIEEVEIDADIINVVR